MTPLSRALSCISGVDCVYFSKDVWFIFFNLLSTLRSGGTVSSSRRTLGSEVDQLCTRLEEFQWRTRIGRRDFGDADLMAGRRSDPNRLQWSDQYRHNQLRDEYWPAYSVAPSFWDKTREFLVQAVQRTSVFRNLKCGEIELATARWAPLEANAVKLGRPQNNYRSAFKSKVDEASKEGV